MEKIGRNEPCPCGSGKKYKKCCLQKEQEFASRQRAEAAAASRALDWLASEYAGGVKEAVRSGFYGGIKKTERERLKELSGEVQELLNVNIGEWLLTDAKIPVYKDMRPVRDILLGSGGVPLSEVGLRWLRNLGKDSLGLFEVQQVKVGEGLLVKNLLRSDESPVWVRDRTASSNMVQWDVFGARLVRNDKDCILSGALYPFTREEVVKCRARIQRKLKDIPLESPLVRDTYASIIITDWLKSLVAKELDEPGAHEPFSLNETMVASWPDEPISLLGDRTPRKAVKTDAGRRAVVELLKSHENLEAHRARIQQRNPEDFSSLWDVLGLKREGE